MTKGKNLHNIPLHDNNNKTTTPDVILIYPIRGQGIKYILYTYPQTDKARPFCTSPCLYRRNSRTLSRGGLLSRGGSTKPNDFIKSFGK